MRRAVAQAFLRATGWQPEGPRPASRRYVLIAAPHTSSWDLAYLLALAACYDVTVSWMGKASLFRGPRGALLRRLGGIPVDRTHRGNLVRQMAALFEERDRLALVVPAEGTRSYTAHWRSGFYHIARTANVPVVLGYLDYQRKRGGFGPELVLTGDVAQDMDEIRGFYSDKVGRYPQNFGPVRLKEEML
jgi:1-acyl-sn-glycerol-3-phosphate acyltransferase